MCVLLYYILLGLSLCVLFDSDPSRMAAGLSVVAPFPHTYTLPVCAVIGLCAIFYHCLHCYLKYQLYEPMCIDSSTLVTNKPKLVKCQLYYKKDLHVKQLINTQCVYMGVKECVQY